MDGRAARYGLNAAGRGQWRHYVRGGFDHARKTPRRTRAGLGCQFEVRSGGIEVRVTT
jgi:hypothetical protein